MLETHETRTRHKQRGRERNTQAAFTLIKETGQTCVLLDAGIRLTQRVNAALLRVLAAASHAVRGAAHRGHAASRACKVSLAVAAHRPVGRTAHVAAKS